MLIALNQAFSDYGPSVFALDLSTNYYYPTLVEQFKKLPAKAFKAFLVAILKNVDPTIIEDARKVLRHSLRDIWIKVNKEEAIRKDLSFIEQENQKIYDLEIKSLQDQEAGFLEMVSFTMDEQTLREAQIRLALEIRYQKLARLNPPEEELRRATAIRDLLDRKDFETAQNAIYANELLSEFLLAFIKS
jgi:hypothetical protein